MSDETLIVIRQDRQWDQDDDTHVYFAERAAVLAVIEAMESGIGVESKQRRR